MLPSTPCLRCQSQAARNDFAADGRHRRSVSLGASEGASDPATPQEATSDEAWEGEPGQEVVRLHVLTSVWCLGWCCTDMYCLAGRHCGSLRSLMYRCRMRYM